MESFSKALPHHLTTTKTESFPGNCSDSTEFAFIEIIDVTILVICTVCGTLGNLLVIFSIIFNKKSFKNGNTFMINLAIADLIVCSFPMPTAIANVVKDKNVLSESSCIFAGYIMSVTCISSICNLLFIASCRYWYVVRHTSYHKVFSKRNIIFMIIFVWVYSNLIASPTLLGWSRIIFDEKLVICIYDDRASISYNIAVIVLSFVLAVVVILVCYWRLFRYVKQHNKTMKQRQQFPNNIPKAPHTYQARMKREMNLLKTLAVTIVIFLLCWTPYCIIALFFAETVSSPVKRIAGRLGLSNSAMNFIVYGAMNPAFRKGYKSLVFYIFCCKDSCQREASRPSAIKITSSLNTYTQANKVNT